jgi:two-component system sensor histidine kinase UhpB
LEPIEGSESSATGELRDHPRGDRHLPAVGASGAGANRAATLAQLRPLTIPVDEDAALVENTIQEERGACLNPLEKRDIHPASGHSLNARAQACAGNVTSERYEQIEIGTLVLVATRQRAVEDSQPNPTLKAKSAAKSSQELPVGVKVLVLPHLQTQPAGTGAPRADGPLRHRTTKRALVGTEIACKLLERSHTGIISPYVRYTLKPGSAWPRYPLFHAIEGLEGFLVTTLVIVVLVVLVAALAFQLLATLRRLAPLEDLIEEMEKVDLNRPGPLPASIDGVGETEEVARIELAFLRMMRRLEAERRRAGSAALRAQEEERARVARDLHDEVNQSLTGLLLRLEAVREAAPPELEPELAATRSLANQAMQELLSLARQLRPTALDDLGLAAAIGGQVEQVERSGLTAELTTSGDFSDLDDDVQLVVYRVVQEALTNAARHSDAERIAVSLRRVGNGVELEASDDGSGFAFEQSERGLGIGGMRERALLIGAELTIESRPGEGTTVRLRVPGAISSPVAE